MNKFYNKLKNVDVHINNLNGSIDKIIKNSSISFDSKALNFIIL
jgi:hypothetical protein